MIILPRIAEILRQIALTNYYHTDTGHLFEHVRQVFDRPHLLAHDRDQNLALWVERPNIGARIIFLLSQPPIARRRGRRIAALTRRFKIRRCSAGSAQTAPLPAPNCWRAVSAGDPA